jgi:hypothetical protein
MYVCAWNGKEKQRTILFMIRDDKQSKISFLALAMNKITDHTVQKLKGRKRKNSPDANGSAWR